MEEQKSSKYILSQFEYGFLIIAALIALILSLRKWRRQPMTHTKNLNDLVQQQSAGSYSGFCALRLCAAVRSALELKGQVAKLKE